MSGTPTMQTQGTPPPWYVDELGAGSNLHTLIDRLGRGDAVLTRYRLGDGMRHLADLDAPDTLAVGGSAFVTAVCRTHAGAWRLEVRCPRCGGLHTHGAGVASLPEFGRRAPPCEGAAYWLRIDRL
jgi:hypothetical protein